MSDSCGGADPSRHFIKYLEVISPLLNSFAGHKHRSCGALNCVCLLKSYKARSDLLELAKVLRQKIHQGQMLGKVPTLVLFIALFSQP